MQVQQPPPRRRIVPPSTQTPATPAGGAFSRSGTISDGSSGFPAGHIRPSSLGVTPGSSTPGGTPIPSGSPITSVAKIVVCVILAIGTISLLSFDIIDVDAFFGTKTGGQLSKGDDDKSVDASSVKEENVVAKEKSVVRKEEIKVAAKFLSKSDRVWAAEIMEIEALIHKNEFQQAVSKCVQLSEKHAKSGYVFLLKGRALKSLAELQRSNEILKKAVSAFESAAHLGSKSDTTDATRIEGYVSAAESLAFLGKPSGPVLLDGMRLYPEEKRLARLYIVSLLRTNKNDKAEQFIREKLAANQDVAFNLVHLGYILDHKGDYEDAVRSLEKGLRMKSEGEHEDKEVHEGRMYQALGDALIRLNRKPEADNWFSFAAKKGIFISQYQRSLYNAPRPIKALPWWSINDASQPMRDGIELLEKNWLKIRDEVTRIMNQNTGAFEAETEGLQKEGDWRQFTLFQRGRKVKSACEKTPFTCELLRRIPDATSCKRGQIKFSVMKAGTHVWPHTGPSNCRIRTHLGLIIPPGPKLRVATETREWAEGKMILFDDSFEHEVWHNGNSTRLVLIVDFWHPELTLDERRTLTEI